MNLNLRLDEFLSHKVIRVSSPSGLSTAFGRPQKTLNTERVED